MKFEITKLQQFFNRLIGICKKRGYHILDSSCRCKVCGKYIFNLGESVRSPKRGCWSSRDK